MMKIWLIICSWIQLGSKIDISYGWTNPCTCECIYKKCIIFWWWKLILSWLMKMVNFSKSSDFDVLPAMHDLCVRWWCGWYGESTFIGCWFLHDFLRMTKFFWQSGLIDMIFLKDLNDIVCQLFADDDGLSLFPWFSNEEIGKGVQIFTIFPRYLHNKSRYLPPNLWLYYFRTSANWSTHNIWTIS